MPSRKLTRIFEFEKMHPREVPFAFRSFAAGFHNYSVARDQLKMQLGTTAFVKPILDWIDAIDHELEEAKQQLQMAIDKNEFGNLRERMLFQSEGLESVLDDAPHLPSFQTGSDQDLEDFLCKIDDYYDELIERVRRLGYGLYDHLISSV